jgi:hypothetical protein
MIQLSLVGINPRDPIYLDVRYDLNGGGGGGSRRSERRAYSVISDQLASVLAFSIFFSCNSVIFIGSSFVREMSFLAYFECLCD